MVAVSPTIYGQVMLTSGSRVSGVVVRGVDPDRVNHVVNVAKLCSRGQSGTSRTTTYSSRRSDSSPSGDHLGRSAGQPTGVFLGSPVQVVSPLGSPTAIGVIPKVRRFVVVGILKTGMSEIDSTLVFMSLAEAQKFFDLGDAVTNIEMRVRNVYQSRQNWREQIQRRFGFPYLAEDWTRLWPNLFSALRLEKTVYFLVLLLMVLIGAFNIVSTLIMVVMEKKKDIAILRSMGASRGSIRKIFLLKRLLDRRCRHLSRRGLGTGHLHLDSRISFQSCRRTFFSFPQFP